MNLAGINDFIVVQHPALCNCCDTIQPWIFMKVRGMVTRVLLVNTWQTLMRRTMRLELSNRPPTFRGKYRPFHRLRSTPSVCTSSAVSASSYTPTRWNTPGTGCSDELKMTPWHVDTSKHTKTFVLISATYDDILCDDPSES